MTDSTSEIVPDFHSTNYTYMGIEGERAPRSTIVGRVHKSVKTICWFAFYKCHEMTQCFMDGNDSKDGIEIDSIEDYAFAECTSLSLIQLPRALKYIGSYAFHQCTSIHVILLPHTIQELESGAFNECRELRIIGPFPLPNATEENVFQFSKYREVFRGCDALFEVNDIIPYQYESKGDNDDHDDDDHDAYPINQTEVHQSISEIYDSLTPLHKLCLDPMICPRLIHEYFAQLGNGNGNDNIGHSSMTMTDQHYRMNPLHILVINPYIQSTPDVIMAYLHYITTAINHNNTRTSTAASQSLDGIFNPDYKGMSPLDYVKQYDNLEAHTCMIQTLCLHRDNALSTRRQA